MHFPSFKLKLGKQVKQFVSKGPEQLEHVKWHFERVKNTDLIPNDKVESDEIISIFKLAEL